MKIQSIIMGLGLLIFSTLFAATAEAVLGYPYADSGLDPWGFYKRQCTSYAAWVLNSNGIKMSNTMIGPNGKSGRFGNGGNWDNNARDIGFVVDNNPVVGNIGVLDPFQGGAGSAGHVVYVKGVNENKSVNISEYNWGGTESYSERKDLHLNHYIHFDECIPPQKGDWIIERDCTIRAKRDSPGSIRVKSNALVTLVSEGSIDVDFINHNLRVESGSGVLVKNGAKIY